MFPLFTAGDFRNGLHGDVIAFSQYTQANALSSFCSNRNYIAFGENNVVMFDPYLAASLSGHVQMILGVSSEEQVLRPDASTIVTTVKNLETIGNGSILQEPGTSVCAMKPKHIISECHSERTVAIIEGGSGPCPTTVAFGDFAPETLMYRSHSPSMITQA